MIKFFKTIILIICFAHNVWAKQPPAGYASCNGCAGTGITPAINSLLQKNAYGYLQNFITLHNPSDNLSHLEICLYNDATRSLCDNITFQIGDSRAISAISRNPTLQNDPLLQNIYLTASVISENPARNAGVLCLTMPTPYGQAPLICKNVQLSAVQSAKLSCVSAAQACVGVNYSQSIFNFSGAAVECVTDVLNNIFFDSTRCPANETSYLSSLKSFASFQQVLQGTVGALLILYVMMFGFQLVLNQNRFSLEMVAKFIFKFVLVVYFSIGIGSYFNMQGEKTLHNGMIDLGLPILREAANDFTQMVFAAAGTRQLCNFDISQYPKGQKSYALWDIVDCKIGAYLGVKSVYNLGNILSNRNFQQINNPNYSNVTTLINGPNNLDPWADTAEFGFLPTMFLLLLGGNLLAFVSMLTFLLIFFSVVVGFISVYIVCLITMHVLVYIAPIFVPLALFERTSQYFQAWLKATVSCALQPMIIGGFVALMITMYDDVLFGPAASAYNPDPGCGFVTHQYKYNGTTNGIAYSQNYNTFEMVLPAGDSTSCTRNIGYQMIAYMLGEGSTSLNLFIISIPQINDTLDMATNSMILMVFSIIFYYFSSTLYSFAADITGGVNVQGVALNVVEKAVNGVQQAAKAAMTAATKGATEGKGGAASEAISAVKKRSGGDDGAPKSSE